VRDGTVKRHRQLIPVQSQQRILQLAQRCSQVEGTFTLLWHNSSLHQERASWRVVYEHVLKQLSELQVT